MQLKYGGSAAAAAAAVVGLVALESLPGASAHPSAAGMLKRQQGAAANNNGGGHRILRSIVPGMMSSNGKPYPTPNDGNPPPRDSLPQEWIDRYNQVKAAGLIPDIPTTTTDANGLVTYPPNTRMDNVCSWSRTNCFAPEDFYLAPSGRTAPTIDDGPTLATPDLLRTLDQQQLKVTHFIITNAALWNPDMMNAMVDAGVHLGLHTTSHSVLTTKQDLDIVGDLGWNMQLIYDATGKVPLYLRAPEGDMDNRVRAIARHVFGLQNVGWAIEKDARDWCLSDTSSTGAEDSIAQCRGRTIAATVAEQRSWVTGSKDPGFISLNHESKRSTVQVLSQYLPFAKSQGWNVGTVADMQGESSGRTDIRPRSVCCSLAHASRAAHSLPPAPVRPDLPHYQNQWEIDGPVAPVRSILPVLPPFTVVNHGGSTQLPADLAPWQSIRQGTISGSSNSSTSSSTAPASSTSGSSSSSSAASGSGSSSAAQSSSKPGANAAAQNTTTTSSSSSNTSKSGALANAAPAGLASVLLAATAALAVFLH